MAQSGGRLERKPCRLCKEPVVWVQHIKRIADGIEWGKRTPLNPDPLDFRAGNLARVNPREVEGRTDVVEFIPENRRWMFERLYLDHHATCEVWKWCKDQGFSFKECLDTCASNKPILNQSAREDREPQQYSLDRSR
jgi:hypothetical protein